MTIKHDHFIHEIANAYYRMKTDISYVGTWKTFRTPTEPQRSQLWHRDSDDHLILKVFIYLTDVMDAKAGPFYYLKGSHPKGNKKEGLKHVK